MRSRHDADVSDPNVPMEERGVFVPAIMSVGLLFSVATLVRDAVRWTGGRARERRTAIEARMTVSEVCGDGPAPPSEIGILSRRSYLLSALVLLGGAFYITIGSAANFLRDGGYVADIAWLLSISLVIAALLFFLAGVSFAVFSRWPNPPVWTIPPIRTAPLTATPGRSDQGPSWALTTTVLALSVFTAMLVLFVGSGRSVVGEIDEPILNWIIEIDGIQRLDIIDPYGGTILSIILVSFIGMSAFRCRVMAITYPLAFAVSWNTTMLLRNIVDRVRPTGVGPATSFPSGHMVQATFIAGLLPLALYVLLGDKRPATIGRAVLGTLVVGTALLRVYGLHHWPLDALGGIALGLTVVAATHWILEHRRWHTHCGSCPWSDHPGHIEWQTGVFTLSRRRARGIRNLGIMTALLAAAALAVATVVVGIPTDPEGDGLGAAIATPVQLGFVVLLVVAAFLARRYAGFAAVVLALGAMMLGISASIEYRPYIAMGLTALLLVPSVLLWISWQPHETIARIVQLATVTVALLTATGFASARVHDHYFGPTHPESNATPLVTDPDWLWLGSVGTTDASIVAGGLPAGEAAFLHIWESNDDPTNAVISVDDVDGYGVARFDVEDLQPDTRYLYVVEDAAGPMSVESTSAPTHFFTHADGAQDLVVAFGSCARTNSNGAVFDAIRATNPDLYVALGDLHYSNLTSIDPKDHIDQYARALSQPGQAHLFGSVPTAYVWDDHDFGPDNADASSASRDAVSIAYRAAVPHHGVSSDSSDSIAQAFTIGRVRFVITDTRSHRAGASMLGQDQLSWFLDELQTSSQSHALVVWVNPTPWISDDVTSGDDWASFSSERATIANATVDAGIDNIVMASGDAHMLAIDDGSNSNYSNERDLPGFPVLHAAALDRPGNTKGGPYSHGSFPGGGQFGLIEVTDDGGATIDVRLSGHDWDGNEIVSWSTSFTN